MRKLDAKLHFKTWGNAEVRSEWFTLGIRSGYLEIRPNMERFLLKVGRRKYLSPIYSELAKTPENLAWAKSVFEKAKGNYHFVSRSSIEGILYTKK